MFATLPLYPYSFEILDDALPRRHRTVESWLSPSDAEIFVRDGYFCVQNAISENSIDLLRTMVDRLYEDHYPNGLTHTYSDVRFAGQYLQEPHATEVGLCELLNGPIADTVRSLIGPRIVLRAFNIRFSFPTLRSATCWHQDQRSQVSPTPPCFSEPNAITAIVHLRGDTPAAGRTVVAPGSHRWNRILGPQEQFESIDGEVELDSMPRDIVFLHGSLWHRAQNNRAAQGSRRETLLIQFAPSWARPSQHPIVNQCFVDFMNAGQRDSRLAFETLIRTLQERDATEFLEVLGIQGGPDYM